ncbi:MAG TPA: ABC-three component system middle component 2 [Gemmatimonadaceae bacterium]|nr:ABC-three component system middle component 2 [Gemmatimonadaceae bacterium]
MRLFSTPFEVGLRAAFMLAAVAPARCDVRRLVIYDYLLVHSGDVEGGPASLHPATPHRSGELLVKRDLMRDGLTLFVGREIVALHLDAAGVTYSASDLTADFLAYIEVPYAARLREAAAWVSARFGGQSDQELEAYVAEHLGRWGGEFGAEALVREVPL